MNIVIPLLVTVFLAIFAHELKLLKTEQKCGIATLIVIVSLFWLSLLYQEEIKGFFGANPTTSYWTVFALISLPYLLIGIKLVRAK